MVGVVDDLQVSGQQGLQQGGGPALQGLGQHRVVRVGACAHRDGPCLLPWDALDVDQDPHQLRDRQGWVGVIQLDRYLNDGVFLLIKMSFKWPIIFYNLKLKSETALHSLNIKM